MKKFRMKKFFVSFVLVLVSAVSIFSGCNLVQTNVNAYYDRVVAKVGNVEVTKRELLNYYSNVVSYLGYYYAIEDVLEEVINQKLIIEDVKENFQTYVEGIGEVYDANSTDEDLLKRIENKYYYNTAMQKAYDFIDSKILEYENTIRASRGDELIKEDEKEKTDYQPEELYEKKVEKNAEGKYVVIRDKDVQNETTLLGEYDYTHETHGDETTRTKAYNMYANALLRNEKGKNLDTNKDNAVQREIQRVYEIYRDQTYLDFFQNNYEYNYIIDNNIIVEKYKELVKSSYSNFILEGDLNSTEAYNEYISNMQSDASSVYYHPYANSDGEKKGFIQVAHILIKFTDEQLFGTEGTEAEVTLSWKQIYEQKDQHDDDWYEKQLNLWKERCVGQARYDLEDEKANSSHIAGNLYGEAKSYTEIFNEITTELVNASSVQQKAEIINKYAYIYSQDVDKDKKVNMDSYYAVALDSTVSENWAGDFADVCRKIYEDNSAGGYTTTGYFLTNIISKDEDGNETLTFDEENSYAGMDLIFVVGEYENLCDISNIDNLNADFADTLYNTRVMLGKDKSWYDEIYDMVTIIDYSTYRQDHIDTLKNSTTIIYYKDAYSDLM